MKYYCIDLLYSLLKFLKQYAKWHIRALPGWNTGFSFPMTFQRLQVIFFVVWVLNLHLGFMFLVFSFQLFTELIWSGHDCLWSNHNRTQHILKPFQFIADPGIGGSMLKYSLPYFLDCYSPGEYKILTFAQQFLTD